MAKDEGKRSQAESIASALFVALIFYFVGWHGLEDPVWFLDLRWWWLTGILSFFVFMIYYQTRNNI